MKKTIFYLKTCSTCSRIMKEIGVDDSWTKREIKSQGITKQEVEKMKEMAGSYETLFSRRAMKYRSLGLKDKTLNEEDYKQYIIDEYTFLKRPVIIIDDDIFVGSGKKTIEQVKERLEEAE